jgi:tripartite-type tricarboxylate transporter receptor subunit TctC
MKRSLIAIVAVLFLISGFSFGSNLQAAEQYPVKPITVIIPLEAGSDGDNIMRPLMEKASAILGRPIMVVNKPGGGMTTGYLEMYRAKPDGYTIGTFAPTIVANKLQGLSPLDYNDFTLIGGFYVMTPVLVASTKTQRPFRSVEEVFTFAKSHPGEVSISTTALGGAWWIATMLLEEGTGLKFNKIPQPGSGAFVIAQVASGHTDLAITGIPTAKGQMEVGNVRPLAVVGPARFSGKYSNIPTLKEQGYGISFQAFGGVLGPPKMPKDITAKLVETFKIAGTHPEYRRFVVEQDNFPSYLPPDQLLNFCDEKRKVYRLIFDKAGLLKEK